MMIIRKNISLFPRLLSLVAISYSAQAQVPGHYDAIHSGTPWFDQRGLPISAHGAGIVKDGNRYYMFGEAHEDMTNAFAGFNCYSSKDLSNWRFEGVALSRQQSGPLGPQTVGERPKVMRAHSTGEYVMFMHADTMDYKGQFIGYATSKMITGPYTYRGPILFNGEPIKKWDMGTFQDRDGAGYILLHGGDIYRLTDDYRSIQEHVNKAMAHGFESPALFRNDDTYFFLGSNLTGWERNDNYYFTASSLKGPWVRRGLIAPEGTLTWNSQVTFVLPIIGRQKTSYMFMGDRWSYPRQASAATYVWQPLLVKGSKLTMPVYRDAWWINHETGTILPNRATNRKSISAGDTHARFFGSWKDISGNPSYRLANERGDSVSVEFTGIQATLHSVALPTGGYAKITIRNMQGKNVVSSTVDMYAKNPTPAIKFVTPLLPRGTYEMTVSVIGDSWYWVNKKGDRSGSAGHDITFDRIVVRN